VEVRFLSGETRRYCREHLTPAVLRAFTTEQENPGNRLGVAGVRWVAPDSALPREVTLVDIPGGDACDPVGDDRAEHDHAAILGALPSLDAVLFCTSIRRPFGTADEDLLRMVLAEGIPAIFVLTQVDTAREHTCRHRLITAQAKVDQHAQGLLLKLAEHFGLSSPTVVAVSAHQAMTGRAGRVSGAWRDSGMLALACALRKTARRLREPERDGDREALLRHARIAGLLVEEDIAPRTRVGLLPALLRLFRPRRREDFASPVSDPRLPPVLGSTRTALLP
jgi:hypothetical protein